MNNKILLLLCPILLLTPIWLLIRESPLYLFANDDFYISTFTDKSVDNGSSQIIDLDTSGNVVAMIFELKKGFISPYAGITFSPKEKPWNLAPFNEINLSVETQNTKNLQMTVTTHQDGVTKEHLNLTSRHNGIEVPISDNASSYVLPLNQMQIEQWWLERFKLRSSELGKPDWKRTTSLSLVAKIRLDDTKSQLLKVNSIKFSKNINWFYYTSLIISCVWFLGLFIYYRYSKNKSNPVVIKYQQTNTNSPEKDSGQDVIGFISSQYTNPDLSLVQISEALKISEKQISAHIKKQFNLSFKEYLNGIRITEAKRLLQITEKNISEIAYQVGFNSPNHFNRTFKNLEQQSPSDYRKQLKNQ